jgi:hypothetical protein
MMHMGFRTNRNLPNVPMYLDLQPADHNRIMYSTPKNTTRQISCRKQQKQTSALDQKLEMIHA